MITIVIVAGVAGAGKTTVGTALAARLRWRFADADEFHPAANIAKMRAGTALDDADRGPWLAAMAAWLDERISRGEPAVLACSALRRRYRDRLLHGRPQARLVFLTADRDLLTRRLADRPGHFFPGGLLGSQLAAAELPGPGEAAVTVAASGPPQQTAAAIIAVLWPGGSPPPGGGRTGPGGCDGEHEAET